jgi:hypothetical protein
VAVTERSRARVIYRLPDQRASRAAGLSVAPTRLSLLLLALVLFSGGLVIGRGSARPQSAANPPAASQPSTATAANPPATAAAPSTVTVRVSKAGPERVVDGVGVGWARSREGAVAAATNYTEVLGGALMLDDTARNKAITVLATPKAQPGLKRSLAEAAKLTRTGLRLPAGTAGADRAVVRTVPLGYQVERYDQGKARVAIWTMGLAGSTADVPVPVAAGYGVTVVDLEWTGKDWKQVKATSESAPTPLAPADEVPSPASAFLQQTRQFKEYDYAPQP